MNDIVRFHRGEYGHDPDVIVSAPAVINLIGEHTDYSDGKVLEFAVDRYLTVGSPSVMTRRCDFTPPM